MTKNRISKKSALEEIAKCILHWERDNYLNWCDENQLDPRDFRGINQSNHLYALALIGLGLEFKE